MVASMHLISQWSQRYCVSHIYGAVSLFYDQLLESFNVSSHIIPMGETIMII